MGKNETQSNDSQRVSPQGGWLRSIFTTQKGGISSKRVCGVLIVLTCLFVLVWCTIKVIQAPNFADVMLICAAGLLGVDSVVKPFVKSSNQNVSDTTKKEMEN